MSTQNENLHPSSRPEFKSDFHERFPKTNFLMDYFNSKAPARGQAWDDLDNRPLFNPRDFQIREVCRISKEEKKSTFKGEETITFDLVINSDGSTVEVNVKSEPTEGCKCKGSDHGSLHFDIDLSGIDNEEDAKKALTAFNYMVISTLAECSPAGNPLNIYSTPTDKWGPLSDKLFKKDLINRYQEFVYKGIEDVSFHAIDGKTYDIGALYRQQEKAKDNVDKLENTPQERKRPSAFDPRAKPSIKPRGSEI